MEWQAWHVPSTARVHPRPAHSCRGQLCQPQIPRNRQKEKSHLQSGINRDLREVFLEPFAVLEDEGFGFHALGHLAVHADSALAPARTSPSEGR
jgi:hypothetical protein